MQSQNVSQKQRSQVQGPSSQNPMKIVFQQFRNINGLIQPSEDGTYSPHLQLGNDGTQRSSHEAKQSQVQGQVHSQYQLLEKGSLIESVDKQQYVQGSEVVIVQRRQNLLNVPQANSKITHRPITTQVINLASQNQHYVASNVFKKQNVNPSVPIIQGNLPAQSVNLRHTITGGQGLTFVPVNQVVSNKNFNLRNSLPPNMVPPMQQSQGSNNLMSSQNQTVRPNQQTIVPSQPQTFVPSQPQTFVQRPVIMPQQQIVRTHQHMTQRIVQGKKVESSISNHPMNFIKNGPQRLEQSQLIYRQINSNIMNPPIAPVQQQIISRQNSRGQSVQIVRSSTRSLERKSIERKGANIVFNYKIQENQSAPINQVHQTANKSQGKVIEQRPVLNNSKPVTYVPIQAQIQPIQVINQNTKQTKVTTVKQQETSKQKNIWQQRYYALYSKVVHINKKVQFINEDFIKFQKVIAQIKEEKSHKRYHKLTHVIQELQQDFTSIVHQWKPEGQFAPQSKDGSAHVEIKYKRLLYNFSKLQEQNESMKKKLQEKIHEVVVKLENENELLKSKLSQIPQPSVPQLSSGEKEELQVHITKLQQKNRILEDEITRLNETKQQIPVQSKQKAIGVQNIENIIQELNEKIRSYQGRMTVLEEQNHNLKNQNSQLQINNNQLNEEINHLNVEISTLETELKHSNQQIQSLKLSGSVKIGNNLINKDSANLQTLKNTHKQQIQAIEQELVREQQKTVFLRDELERVSVKYSQLLKELNRLQASQQLTSTQQMSSLTSTISHHEKDSLQKLQIIEQLESHNNKLHSKNISLNEQIERLNEKLADNETKINEYKIQINEFKAQITHFQTQLQQYQTQSLNLQQQQSQSPLLIQQYEFTIATLRSQINRKENEIQRESKLSDQRIIDLTEQLKMSYKERENLHKKFQEKTLLLESEREKKEILIRELRDKIYELEHKKMLDEQEGKRKKKYQNQVTVMNQNREINRLRDELELVRSHKDRAEKQHQLEVKKLSDECQQYAQDNLRLKKQIAQLASTVNQLQTVSQALNKKNMEIMQLKNIAFQNEKLQIQNSNQKKEIERLTHEIDRLNQQYDKLNKTYLQTVRNFKQVEQNLNILNNRFASLQAQYTTNLDSYQRKEQENIKLKQLNQQLENQLDQFMKDNQKLKNKLKNAENSYEQKIKTLHEQIQTLKQKLNDFDRLVREKANLESRITELQSYKQKYQYQLKENEDLMTKQKSKIKTLQSENEDLAQQIQNINEKTKEQQKKFTQSTKKYKKLIEELQQKIKSFQDKQVKIEKQKIHQLQIDIKAKQNKIWKLQKQLQEALQRLDDFGDQEMASQKIAYLEQKVKQYEARLFNQAFKFNPSSYDYEASKVFERQVIYELKEQNERLREFINQKRSSKPTTDRLKASKIEQQLKEAYDEQLDEVQGRLATFNNKLQSLINNGSYENVKEQEAQKKKVTKSPTKNDLKSVNSNSLIKMVESEAVSRELRELKLKYAELERYCKNIEVQLLSGNATSQKSIQINKAVSSKSANQSILNDQLTFLKQKNKQLQERVDKLLKMNNELKENIENLLRQKSESSSVTYYKEQISELNEKINVSEFRTKKLLQQNEKLKSKAITLTKSEEAMQVKMFDFERKSIQLQRMVNELNLIKSSLEKDLQSKTQLLQTKQFEINQLKGKIALSSEKESIVVKSCKQQIQNYESQIMKLTNKIKIHESEIERLNDSMRKKQTDSSEQIQRWRSKANQLQQDLVNLTNQHEKEMQIQSSLKIQVSRLGQQLKASQYENQQLHQVNENLTKKLQQSEAKVRQLKMDKQMLQSDLNIKTTEATQRAGRIQKQEEQLYKLMNQVELLKQEVQRLNDENRAKQRTFEFEVRTLQDKLSYTEKDLLNSRKYVSTLEEQKRSFEEELSKSQFQVSLLFKEIQQRDKTYADKQTIYEDKITLLKNQITSIEASSASLQENISAMNILRQKYEMQIYELRNQIAILKSEVQRYEEMVREKDTVYQQLRNDYELLNEQRSRQQNQMMDLLNKNGILQSQIERLMSTIVEKDSSLITMQGSSQSLDREVNKCISQITSLRQQNESLIEKIKQIEKIRASQVSSLTTQINILKRQNEDLKRSLDEFRAEKQGMEEQLTRWMNRVSLLGQQNEKLISRTKTIDSMSSLSSQIEALKRQNQDLRMELVSVQNQLSQLAKEYQSKVSYMQQKMTTLAYQIELNRSIYIEVETLVEQLQYSSVEQSIQVREKVSKQIEKGIRNVRQSGQILTAVTLQLSIQQYQPENSN